MHTSTDRILTTHAGSIPRGEPLGQMLIDEEAGKPVDGSALQSNIGLRVSHVCRSRRKPASVSSMMANRDALGSRPTSLNG